MPKLNELSTKRKVGIGVAITAAIAGIAGAVWGLFGRRNESISEDDYEYNDPDTANATYTEEN